MHKQSPKETKSNKRKRPDVPLSNADWEALRQLMLDEAQEHDQDTAFTENNHNVHAALAFLLQVYQYGRERVLPPQWADAFATLEFRRTDAWKLYQQARKWLEQVEKDMTHQHEYINLSQVIGEPMQAVLEGELQRSTHQTHVTTTHPRPAKGRKTAKKTD